MKNTFYENGGYMSTSSNFNFDNLWSEKSTDAERGGSYSWKYYEWTEAIVAEQDECAFVNTGG